MRITKGQKQIEADGFTDVQHYTGGRWFTAKDTNGEEICFLRQGATAWHAFYACAATGSGGSPRQSLSGGLGDVIDNDFTEMQYCYLVKTAPRALSLKFEGLYAAGVQVMNPTGR